MQVRQLAGQLLQVVPLRKKRSSQLVQVRMSSEAQRVQAGPQSTQLLLKSVKRGKHCEQPPVAVQVMQSSLQAVHWFELW